MNNQNLSPRARGRCLWVEKSLPKTAGPKASPNPTTSPLSAEQTTWTEVATDPPIGQHLQQNVARCSAETSERCFTEAEKADKPSTISEPVQFLKKSLIRIRIIIRPNCSEEYQKSESENSCLHVFSYLEQLLIKRL